MKWSNGWSAAATTLRTSCPASNHAGKSVVCLVKTTSACGASRHFGALRNLVATGHNGHWSSPYPSTASMQGEPKRVGPRSNWNKIGKHGHAYETTPEPSTRGVVDITKD